MKHTICSDYLQGPAMKEHNYQGRSIGLHILVNQNSAYPW